MIKDSKNTGDRIFSLIIYAVLGLAVIITLYPLVLALSVSISDELTVQTKGYSLIPAKPTLETYRYIFQGGWIGRSYGVTLFVTAAGTALSLLVTAPLAYAISVKSLKYRNGIAFYCYFTMIFSAGLVPWYIVLTRYYHLSNRAWVLILPYLLNPFYMFLMRNYFQSIPESVSESAKIDGAHDVTIFFRIILPLSVPILATVSLFIALAYWNDWWLNLLFVTNTRLYTLQYQLFQILSNALFFNSGANSGLSTTARVPTETVKMATTIVTIGPIVFLYPFLQRYFIKGIMIGAIKG